MPHQVSDELKRLVDRWRQLPVDDARARMPAVRALVESLAGRPVPDLGPAVVMDQLTVMVYDAAVAQTHEAGSPAVLAARLAELRGQLSRS